MRGLSAFIPGSPIEQFNIDYSPQHMNVWCWAACISMVFAYYRHPVSQPRIVAETWGDIVNLPGRPDQMLIRIRGHLLSARPLSLLIPQKTERKAPSGNARKSRF